MLLQSNFLTLCLILCFAMIVPAVSAAEIALPADTIIIEAESGEMEGGVNIIDDDEASEGQALDHPVGAKTSYEVDIPKKGDWFVWIRMNCPNGSQDSYWIGMDDVDPSPPDDAQGEPAIKIYSDAGDSVNTDAQPFNLWFWDSNASNPDPHGFLKVKDVGKHTLWAKGREQGTLIDQLLLTLDSGFSPEEAAQGGAIPVYQAVSSRDKLAVTWGNIKTP
ncbi:hypothetical protein ACFL6S_17230 [Candidatus Poribacteria bacterium]